MLPSNHLANKNICFVLGGGNIKSIRENYAEDIYTQPWIQDLSSSYNIYFSDHPFYERLLPISKVIVIGQLPYKWSKQKRRQIDGFIHIIVDKYLYQSSEIPFFIRSLEDSKRLIRCLYKDFNPGSVIVNNSIMMNDFSRSFKSLNKNIKVYYVFHPITALSLSKKRKTNIRNPHKYVLYDSTLDIKPFIDKNINNPTLSKSILCIPYNSLHQPSQDVNIVALLNLRPPSLRSFKFSNILKLRNLRLVYFFLISTLQAPFINLLFRNRLLDKPSLVDLNARWKPSAKVSAAVGMGLTYFGPAEQSSIEMINHYKINSLLIDRPTDLSKQMQLLFTGELPCQVNSAFISKDIDRNFKHTFTSLLSQ